MRIFRSVSLRAFEYAFNGIWLVGESCITIHTTITRINIFNCINPRRSKIYERWGYTSFIKNFNTNIRICKLDSF